MRGLVACPGWPLARRAVVAVARSTPHRPARARLLVLLVLVVVLLLLVLLALRCEHGRQALHCPRRCCGDLVCQALDLL